MQLWLTLAGTGCLATADTGWTAVRAHERATAAERFSSCCRCIFRKGPYLVRQHGGRNGMKGRGAQRVTLVNLVFLFFARAFSSFLSTLANHPAAAAAGTRPTYKSSCAHGSL